MVWYGMVRLVRHGIIGEKQGTTTMGKRNETHSKSRRRDFSADKGNGWCVCGVSRLVYHRGEEEEAQINSNGRRNLPTGIIYQRLSLLFSPSFCGTTVRTVLQCTHRQANSGLASLTQI